MPRKTTKSEQEKDEEWSLVGELERLLAPDHDVIEQGPLVVSGRSVPAARAGGDWWTARALDDGRLLVLVTDVTGHGVDSAMIMGIGTATCDLACMAGARLDPAELLHQLDEAVGAAGRRRGLSMTCFATLLDGAGRKLEFANAGHTMPYLLRRSAAGYELGSLVSRGPALGAGDGSYQTHRQDLVSGDTFLWFSDGASECIAPSGEVFGERRLRRTFLETIGQPVVKARDHLLAALVAFQGDAPATDDRTIVVGRFE